MANPNIAFDDEIMQQKYLYFYIAKGLGAGTTLNSGVGAFTTVNTDGMYNKVLFQFPPIIRSDNKGASWKEIQTRQAEPIAIFWGATPRTFDVKWTYVVDRMPRNNIIWSGKQVSEQVKTVRSYFYNRIGTNIIIKFRAYEIVGSSGQISNVNSTGPKSAEDTNLVNSPFWSFRADNVSISHSDTLINDNGAIYPLRTDITMQMKFLIDGTIDDIGEANSKNDDDSQKKVMKEIEHTKIRDIKKIPSNLSWL